MDQNYKNQNIQIFIFSFLQKKILNIEKNSFLFNYPF